MVAKSYEGLPQVTGPYEVGGRAYVKVRTKSGNIKQVRWYSDREYLSMYGPSKLSKYYKSQKTVLGFEKDYITILYNPEGVDDQFFRDIGASKTKFWNWYIKSNTPIPALPPEIIPMRLNWDAVGNDNETLKADDEVYAAVRRLTASSKKAKTAVTVDVGEPISITVSVEKVIDTENAWGASHLHVLRDDDNNIYTWRTNARRLLEGHKYHLSGKVKGFENYKGEVQTQIFYCKANEV